MAAASSSEEHARAWLTRLMRLNPYSGRGKCRGKAPHKPLLLLCLLDMAGSGELPARAFTRTAALALRFRSYGALVVDRWPNRLDLRLPFFHLSTQGFWEPLTAEMQRPRHQTTAWSARWTRTWQGAGDALAAVVPAEVRRCASLGHQLLHDLDQVGVG